MKHLEQGELLGYLRHDLPPDEMESAAFHVAVCPACSKRMNTLMSIREDFDSAWKNFLGDLSGMAQPQVPGVHDIVVRGLVNRERRFAVLSAHPSHDHLGRFGSRVESAFPQKEASARTQDAELARQGAVSDWEDGRIEEAVLRLSQVAQSDPSMTECARLEIEWDGEAALRIELSSHQQMIKVSILPRSGLRVGRSVYLYKFSDRQLVDRRSLLRRGARSEGFAAFEGISNGVFSLGIDLESRAKSGMSQM